MQDRPRTGLVVPIPEAEAMVGAHRLSLDPAAALGVPAHVTALFPFVPVDALDESVLTTVADVVGEASQFDYSFTRTAWFGDDVVWLAPDEPAPFRELTTRLAAAFPEHPPYEGAHAEVVPHLTVGHGRPRRLLEEAEQDVRRQLPITGVATEVVLLAETQPGGRWEIRGRFPLDGVNRR